MKYKTPAALEMAVKAAAKKSSLDTNRAIAGFYFHRFLCRVFSKSDSGFVLKGGQGMLARTVDARYTRDIDLLCRDLDLQEALSELKKLASIDLDDFVRFEFEGSEPIRAEDEYRNGSSVSFSAWVGAKMVQVVSIDLVVDVVDDALVERVTPKDRIEVKGVEVFDYMVCGVEDALADKLFGIVEMHNGRPSTRVKDLVDILVYASTCSINGSELSRKVRRESSLRKTTLPDSFAIPDAWRKSYRPMFKKLCEQTGIGAEYRDMHTAEKLAGKLFDPVLANCGVVGVWDPVNHSWD